MIRKSVAAVSVAALLAACGTAAVPPPPPSSLPSPPATAVTWLADDLVDLPDTGRQILTCEAVGDEDREQHVLVPVGVADHQVPGEGAPCPDWEVVLPDHRQAPEAKSSEAGRTPRSTSGVTTGRTSRNPTTSTSATRRGSAPTTTR